MTRYYFAFCSVLLVSAPALATEPTSFDIEPLGLRAAFVVRGQDEEGAADSHDGHDHDVADDFIDAQYYDDGHSHSIKHSRPDSHAPANLMGDHVHEQGEWMVEYKFMHMYMDGMRAGTTSLGDDASRLAVNNGTGVNFMVTPTRMTMDMHMIHVMRGWTDNVTLYVMPTVLDNSMDHLTGTGVTFNTRITGFGDLPFGALWRIYEGETDELIVNVGFSAPTGQIRTLVDTGPPPAPGTTFPYPMRLGSGTFDARPGVTYKSYGEMHTFGLQYQTDVPIGKNYRGYREGQEHRLNAWITRLIGCERKLALSYRAEALFRDAFVGFDTDLGPTPTLISTIRPEMRGGEWINFGYGFIYLGPQGGRWNVELAHPVYQNLRGVQLETDLTLAASYSKAF